MREFERAVNHLSEQPEFDPQDIDMGHDEEGDLDTSTASFEAVFFDSDAQGDLVAETLWIMPSGRTYRTMGQSSGEIDEIPRDEAKAYLEDTWNSLRDFMQQAEDALDELGGNYG